MTLGIQVNYFIYDRWRTAETGVLFAPLINLLLLHSVTQFNCCLALRERQPPDGSICSLHKTCSHYCQPKCQLVRNLIPITSR